MKIVSDKSYKELLDHFPAKSNPTQTLETHCVLTGRVAQSLLANYLSSDVTAMLADALGLDSAQCNSFVGYLAAGHDVGKLSTSFAYSISKNLENRDDFLKELRDFGITRKKGFGSVSYRHEATSQSVAYNSWHESGAQGSTELFSQILGIHHQRTETGMQDVSHGNKWSPLRAELLARLEAWFDWTELVPVIREENEAYVGAILAGLVILSDWIASSATFTDFEKKEDLEDGRIEERISQFLTRSGLVSEAVDFPNSFGEVWPLIGEGARPLQRALENMFQDAVTCPELLIIEAPMGSGKTEGAIYAATQLMNRSGKNGFYMALPTAATSNQMQQRTKTFLKEHDPNADTRLLHAMAWLVDDRSDSADTLAEQQDPVLKPARDFFKPVRRGLLSPFAVGTVDQAMMAAMFIRYGALRLLGLANKVLIIDEMHAYDAYMNQILTRLLEWCHVLHIPVVLLSATLTMEKKAELLAPYGISMPPAGGEAYPLITAVDQSGRINYIPCEATQQQQPIEVSVAPLLYDPATIAQRATEIASDGGCLGIVVNTVQQAQEVYAELQSRWDGELLLFHAQFPAKQRDDIERQCIKWFGPNKSERPKKAVLVATQVVEQSLDVDFDALMTAAAPVDLILQRAGRLHRHDASERPAHLRSPMLTVLTDPLDEYTVDEMIYPACLLRRGVAIMRDKGEIRIPQDLRQIVEAGYDIEACSPDAEEMEKWMDKLLDDQTKAAMAIDCMLASPEYGFQPLKQQPVYDDLESSTYVSAKTRLGQPSKRIALLEPDLMQLVRSEAGSNGIVAVRKVELAQKVLEQSVSVPERKMNGFRPDLIGEDLLWGVEMYAAQNGVHEQENGRRITFDPKLGVVWN